HAPPRSAEQSGPCSRAAPPVKHPHARGSSCRLPRLPRARARPSLSPHRETPRCGAAPPPSRPALEPRLRLPLLVEDDTAGALGEPSRAAVSRPIPLGTMGEMEQYPQEWRDYEPIQPKGFDWRAALRKLWAPIAAIGAFLAKFGAVLLKFKFLFSMFVSAAVYVWIGGWWFGIGLVVLLFVHEMGH